MSNIIKIEDAKIWTAKWQNENSNHCKAFLIPVQDLLGTLSEMGIISIDAKGNISGSYSDNQNEMIRSYLAIKPDEVKNPGKGEKLLLVGTINTHKKDKNGNIIYQDIVEGEGYGNGGAAAYSNGTSLNGSGVYDFTAPCPNNCDTNSPLNH